MNVSVLVVGAGIGGLTTAAALHRIGAEVVVVEQGPASSKGGAGLMLTPGSLRQREGLYLRPKIRRRERRIDAIGYRHHDGTATVPMPARGVQSGPPKHAVKRGALVAMLRALLPADRVRFGQRVVDAELQEDSATVVTDRGDRVPADVVVAADGIRSRLRAHVDVREARLAGQVAYRAIIDRPIGWPPHRSVVWLGLGRHAVAYPIGPGRRVNFVGFVPEPDEHLAWTSVSVDPEVVRGAFHGWDVALVGLLRRLDACIVWQVADLPPLSTWVRVRLALLGDAGHAKLPHLGQGANQAIEDAACLATLLADIDASAVAEALRAYDAHRRDRVRAIQQLARHNGRLLQHAGNRTNERDVELRRLAGLRQGWYDHDAADIIRSAVRTSTPDRSGGR